MASAGGGTDPGRGSRWAAAGRIALGVLCLALVLLGASAATRLEFGAGGMSAQAADLTRILLTVVMVLAVAVAVRQLLRRVEDDEPMLRRRRKDDRLLRLVAWAIAGALFLWWLKDHDLRLGGPSKAAPPTADHATGGGGVSVPAPPWVLLLGALALTGVALLLWRSRRRLTGAVGPLEDGAAEPLSEEHVAAALESGRTALALGDDDRAAVLAAYAAMQDVLAGAGARAGATETPLELLDRCALRWPGVTSDASVLTGTFQRARYSHATVTPADRVAVAAALEGVRAGVLEPSARPDSGVST